MNTSLRSCPAATGSPYRVAGSGRGLARASFLAALFHPAQVVFWLLGAGGAPQMLGAVLWASVLAAAAWALATPRAADIRTVSAGLSLGVLGALTVAGSWAYAPMLALGLAAWSLLSESGRRAGARRPARA